MWGGGGGEQAEGVVGVLHGALFEGMRMDHYKIRRVGSHGMMDGEEGGMDG